MSTTPPTPERFFETIQAYQRTAALRAAIELDLFTAIGEGASGVAGIAKRCRASERGTRMLCDFLTIMGFLSKGSGGYALAADAAAFLDRNSPAYLGGTLEFLTSPQLVGNFDHLAATVRRGTVGEASNTVAPDNPIWQKFARAMVPMMLPAAQAIAELLGVASAGAIKVLDIAAGHGIFGITLAQRNPAAEVLAVDWEGVLEVARENARKAGLGARHRTLAGDAFQADWGTGFDVALVTNFLHHFDIPTCTSLLRKVAAALKPGGSVAVLEFVPNEDRVTPPTAAAFLLNMLAGTPAGDAYTLRELSSMLEAAGLGRVASHPLPGPQTVVVARK